MRSRSILAALVVSSVTGCTPVPESGTNRVSPPDVWRGTYFTANYAISTDEESILAVSRAGIHVPQAGGVQAMYGPSTDGPDYRFRYFPADQNDTILYIVVYEAGKVQSSILGIIWIFPQSVSPVRIPYIELVAFFNRSRFEATEAQPKLFQYKIYGFRGTRLTLRTGLTL